MRINIFICHADEDHLIAKQVADCFEKCLGFKVFYSKESLIFSEDWLNDIWIALDKSDLFIPLLSANLNKSAFANQEIGVAIARSKRIVPLSIDGSDPRGFVKNQANKLSSIDEDSILKFATLLYFNVFNETKLRPWISLAMDSLIHAFCYSDSFKRTSIILKLIIRTHGLRKFNKDQIKRIVNASKENSMIRDTDFIYPILKQFLQENYKVMIDRND